MSEVTAIHPADLRRIENDLDSIYSGLKAIDNGLGTVNQNVEVVYHEIGTVDQNIKLVYDEVGTLAREFRDYVGAQKRANRLNQAEIRLVNIRQDLEKKYGHYDIVRRTTTGILQADDLGVVKRDTISTAAEELMLSTPGYWLAPCLVALAAWISDQPELAERAVREAIKRNDEKTSLFFALVCRRADRKQACLKWTQRFLANQDEEQLDRNTIIILDSYASGLLGSDSEGVICRQIGEWMDHLAEKPGFVEQQTQQWSDAINLKRKPWGDSSYIYLQKYSKTWPVLQDTMEGANLHAEILGYFTSIFSQETSAAPIKVQLDGVLTSLVTDFDDEELPLRKEEKFEQFVVDFEGDEDRAKKNMTLETTAFETHKDFTQLLTDAAMNPESSHSSISTQKFAIALSKDWISNAYNDVVAQNRMKIPNKIEINVDSFNDTTTDGQNEEVLISRFHRLIDTEKADALSQYVLSGFDQFCLYGGGVIGVIGLIMLFAGSVFLGLLASIAGIGLIIKHFSQKKSIEANRETVEKQFEEKQESGTQIIRAILAEVVDFRAEFAEKDAQSQSVLDFLDQIAPEQYVAKLAESNRRIKV